MASAHRLSVAGVEVKDNTQINSCRKQSLEANSDLTVSGGPSDCQKTPLSSESVGCPLFNSSFPLHPALLLRRRIRRRTLLLIQSPPQGLLPQPPPKAFLRAHISLLRSFRRRSALHFLSTTSTMSALETTTAAPVAEVPKVTEETKEEAPVATVC